jgi:glycerol dehydrogenase
MPIKEESFRIGAGRYLQGRGYLTKLGDEILRLGDSALIVGGETALSLTRITIEAGTLGRCKKYEFVTHKGTCNDEDAQVLAARAAAEGYNVIVGIGGGVICDFAKLVAHFAALPVINVPTSSATCAAYTPLSVRYNKEGKTVGSMHYGREVNCVLVDTEIVSRQPVRLFLAGVFDSLAKFVEIKQRFDGDNTECPLGLDYAYVMSKYSYDLLRTKADRGIADMAAGIESADVENLIFTAVAATGVISGIARGSNQTALAHKFYEITRTCFPTESRGYLHGEIVGVGLLLQNHYNGEEENNRELLALMKKYGMPHCISDVGVEATRETLEDYCERLFRSTAVEEKTDAVRAKLMESLEYFWSIR